LSQNQPPSGPLTKGDRQGRYAYFVQRNKQW
jgi:hypothetical protein